MKNRTNILIVLILSVIINFSCKQIQSEKITGWDYKQVNGKVKSYSIREYSVEKDASGKWVKKESDLTDRLIWEAEFNQEGRLITEKIFSSKGEKLRAKWDYIFEENILKKIKVNDLENNISKDISILRVEPEFKIIEMIDNEETSINEWSGKRLLKSSGNTKEYNATSTYIYDNYGNVIRIETAFAFDNKDKPGSIYKSEYENLQVDEKNNWTIMVEVNQYNKTIGIMRERLIIYY